MRMRFNPRPRTGANITQPRTAKAPRSFNPRPRTGANLDTCYPLGSTIVSIRAPVRGRTRADGCRRGNPACFNPRPRTGANGELGIGSPAPSEFQSAPPYGGER